MHKKTNRIYLINLRIHLVQIINTEKILIKKKNMHVHKHTCTHAHTPVFCLPWEVVKIHLCKISVMMKGETVLPINISNLFTV